MSSHRRSRALCGATSLKVTKQVLLELHKCSMKLRGSPLDLQAVLASKLKAGSTEQQSEALMHGILLCERFMANAQGTEAELEVLKQEVKRVLSGQVGCVSQHCVLAGDCGATAASPQAARQRAKKTALSPHKPDQVVAEQPQQVLARATSSAKSSVSLLLCLLSDPLQAAAPAPLFPVASSA